MKMRLFSAQTAPDAVSLRAALCTVKQKRFFVFKVYAFYFSYALSKKYHVFFFL
ncbi:hypothetical protein HMPREF7215_1813 [Pyramidobacter piscolens W5455]|uniref:Uncharacterized protein n=1 Tax=Pyramidobacter piscolens W5455 TaxID=352165 RepID=A0ABM9ZT56_9BACT|nr:hypothetical protein HMPREF7215_1813 [Pyramidobacter piscolens W5455]